MSKKSSRDLGNFVWNKSRMELCRCTCKKGSKELGIKVGKISSKEPGTKELKKKARNY